MVAIFICHTFWEELQDDAHENEDDFEDPAGAAWIDHPYVSVNNISAGSPRDVPRADAARFSVGKDSQRPYPIPAGSACIIVEGRAGSGLSGLAPGNLNPPVSPGGVTARVIEANLRVGEQPGADAAAMAAGDIEALLAGDHGVFTVDSKSGVARVRSKKKIEIEGGHSTENYVSVDGEVHSVDAQLHAAPDSVRKVDTEFEEADAEFYKLAWDDVKKAQPTDHTLAAGTYVVWDDGSVRYYDMSYDEYVAFIESDPEGPGREGTVVDLASDATTFEYDGKKAKLIISDSVLVEATGNTDEFNFIPRKGAQEDPPGASANGSESEQVEAVLGILGKPNSTGTSAGVTGGPQAAKWIIPLTGTVPGGTLRVETGNYSMGTWRGVILRETSSPGVGELIIDSGFQPSLFTPPIGALPLGALADGLQSQFAGDPNLALILSSILGNAGGMQEIDLGPAVEPTLSADDLTVEFKPVKGESAILSADGNVNIASKVKGTGGSITSQGNIRFVGAGSDLSATVEDGLNLYAKGDIILSSLLPKDDGSYDYKDFKMKGVIYTWGDFRAKIGHEDDSVNKWGKFTLEGAIVAYGNKNQASLGDPGDGEGGAIDIKASEVKLTFDAAYLAAIQSQVEPGRVEQTLYTVY